MKLFQYDILTSVKWSKKQLISKGNFCAFSNLSFLAIDQSSVRSLRATEIVKEVTFEDVWDELESKKGFQRQSVTKYLRLLLVFMWNSEPQQKFNGYFSALCCYY